MARGARSGSRARVRCRGRGGEGEAWSGLGASESVVAGAWVRAGRKGTGDTRGGREDSVMGREEEEKEAVADTKVPFILSPEPSQRRYAHSEGTRTASIRRARRGQPRLLLSWQGRHDDGPRGRDDHGGLHGVGRGQYLDTRHSSTEGWRRGGGAGSPPPWSRRSVSGPRGRRFETGPTGRW